MKCVVGKSHVDAQRRQLHCCAEQSGLSSKDIVEALDLLSNRVFVDLRNRDRHLLGRNRKGELCPIEDYGPSFNAHWEPYSSIGGGAGTSGSSIPINSGT